MTVGFIVSFFDFRNDVRKVIEIISSDHKVVVFYKPSDEEKVLSHKINNVEYRPILDRNRTLLNRIKEQLFLYFKKLPKSRNNYFLMEFFKISNLKDDRAIRKGKFVLRMQRILPRLISYDWLLNNLKPLNKTQIDDIDKFFLFSGEAEDYFLARLINGGKAIKCYVYSWDHPFKFTRFSLYPSYLCWSKSIINDIAGMQNIPLNQISVTGASQLCYVHEFNRILLESPLERTFPFEYIYFGCAIGIRSLVPKELAIIKQLAEITLKIRPDLKFVVRPYPVLDQWELYNEIRDIENIVMDDNFRGKDLSIKEEQIIEKYEKIHHAKAFFHLGTTMGLEACFTDTPSLIVDFETKNKNILSLYSFVHQTQNEKYLIEYSENNTIRTPDDFQHFLQKTDDPLFKELNKKVKKEFSLKSFQEFSEGLINS